MVLVSLPNVLEIIMKYVSLSAIANIPRFYYNSLIDHKLLMVSSLKVDIINFRSQNRMKDAPLYVKLGRLIHKSMRILFCCWSYYFMPFTALFLASLVYGSHGNNRTDSIDSEEVIEDLVEPLG